MMHEMPGFRKPDALLFGLRTALQRLNATAKELQSIPSLELQVDFALTPLIQSQPHYHPSHPIST
jgi:hypothetical protein